MDYGVRIPQDGSVQFGVAGPAAAVTLGHLDITTDAWVVCPGRQDVRVQITRGPEHGQVRVLVECPPVDAKDLNW